MIQKVESGSVYINNIKLNHNNIAIIRNQIGYISQEISFKNLTINELIDEIHSYKLNRHIDFSYQNIVNALNKFNLEKSILFNSFNTLSGGEKQRIALAIMTLLDKKLWILDEITSAIDSQNSKLILDFIVKSDITAVIVTHDHLWKKVPSLHYKPWSFYGSK